jgi:uncharacterized protein YbaP (TraB family)
MIITDRYQSWYEKRYFTYCPKDQNYFMAQALHFYRSYELDSIAKVELKRFSSDCLK